jgi:hypothetical protein
MTGEAHWFELLLIVGGGAAIVGCVWFMARVGSLALRQRVHFVCPVTRTQVGATLLQDLPSDQFVDVKRCSGWRHFWRPCEKSCLTGLNDGTISEQRLRHRI